MKKWLIFLSSTTILLLGGLIFCIVKIYETRNLTADLSESLHELIKVERRMETDFLASEIEANRESIKGLLVLSNINKTNIERMWKNIGSLGEHTNKEFKRVDENCTIINQDLHKLIEKHNYITKVLEELVKDVQFKR